jgi:hypothetical protein
MMAVGPAPEEEAVAGLGAGFAAGVVCDPAMRVQKKTIPITMSGVRTDASSD